MTKFYSLSRQGFFDSDLHAIIPDDAIPLTDEEYENLLEETYKNYKKIVVDGKCIRLEEFIPEITWDTIRDDRNKLLNHSDYTQMPDYPGNKQAWAEYRQALRDIPQKYSDPNNVIWPEKPSDK